MNHKKECQNNLRLSANLISVLFHPLFILYYIFLTLHTITPVAFMFSENRQRVAVHLLVFGLSVFFPLISTFALRAAGLIKSIRLEDSKERIGPMIATIIFYVWLFLNYKQFGIGPDIFIATILGATIALSIAFLINNFSKISLHCVGAGGLVGAIGTYRMAIPELAYSISFGQNTLEYSPNILLALIIIIAGLIGSARLYLNVHKEKDVYGGYIIGFTAQIVAYMIMGPF